jgi:hypothetical protein
MQQRQLRLGDIVDDYCPRERRLANHTIVAMVGDEIRLTRCTTCDAEHTYKGGKVPRQRKRTPTQAAYDEVLESVKKDTEQTGHLVNHADASPADPIGAEPDLPQAVAAAADPSSDASDASPGVAPAEEIRLHRPLIRASLPRIETQPPARPIPEFTVRQANRQGRFQNSRAAHFGKGRGPTNSHQGNSKGPGGPHGARHGGRPHGHGQSMPPGQRRHNGPPGHPGKKRSR